MIKEETLPTQLQSLINKDPFRVNQVFQFAGIPVLTTTFGVCAVSTQHGGLLEHDG
jgi:hypothetical protein